MASKGYTSDIQRAISITPKVDVTGQVILAKVYKNGEYIGLANTVKPDPDEASAILSITNTGATENVTVTINAKMRHEDTYAQVTQEVLSVVNGTNEYTITYDQKNNEDVEAVVSAIGANCVVNSIKVQQSQFHDLNGVVIGGPAEQEIAVPCDFRPFEAGDDYTIVFVATDYGVIGKDILLLFAEDGYKLNSDG